LEVPLFHDDKLSFLLNALIEDGVGGSSGLDCAGDFAVDLTEGGRLDLEDAFASKRDSLMVAKSVPVFERLSGICSPPPCGTDEDKKGDMLGFLLDLGDTTADKDSEELPGFIPLELSVRIGWMELLLLKEGRSTFSERCLEKNDVFDAVMGVVGVLGIILDGGGLLRSRSACSCFL